MHNSQKRKVLTSQEYISGILAGNRTLLARAITLIESQLPSHQQQASEIMKALLPQTGRSLRVGISGYPGAGKSTLIEAWGLKLLKQGFKLAVLAIDPSSQLSQGSILGDKTRMEALTRAENCFIRPSPSAGNLGGVARHTREALLLCEAAGYDLILIETVGIGQSEILVRSMVDFFLLVLIPGAGDELQGIKKGVMEMVDAVLVNKADGEHLKQAQRAAQEYNLALKYINPATPGWQAPVLLASALENKGLDELWQVISDFSAATKTSGAWQDRRKTQTLEWFEQSLKDGLERHFFQTEIVLREYPRLKDAVLQEQLPVADAVDKLIAAFFSPQASIIGSDDSTGLMGDSVSRSGL
jgi:LAO/AO transport system kinase